MTQPSHNPVLIVIAGPNGSGKTTITSKLLRHEWMEDALYVNPDIVAQEMFGDWNSYDNLSMDGKPPCCSAWSTANCSRHIQMRYRRGHAQSWNILERDARAWLVLIERWKRLNGCFRLSV